MKLVRMIALLALSALSLPALAEYNFECQSPLMGESKYSFEISINDDKLTIRQSSINARYAIMELRYFFEDYPEIPVIAAGSLLEFVLNDHSFSMPVGRVEYYHLGPMSFEEYLIALGNEKLVSDLHVDPLYVSEMVFEKLSRHLREFYYIG